MALKDLVRKGSPPRPRQHREPVIHPIQVDGVTWFYPEKKGLLVVHEIRDHDRYIRTDQFMIKWVDVGIALEQRKRIKKATKRRPAIKPAR